MFTWKIKFFAELTGEEVYQILKLRQDVFIVEQACRYLDTDNLDQKCLHAFFVSEEHDQVIAYCRILPEGLVSPHVAIGRVVVSPEFRQQGFANNMMTKAIEFIKQEMNPKAIKVSAQSHLNAFYASLGFENISQPFDEDGIEHIDMLLTL